MVIAREKAPNASRHSQAFSLIELVIAMSIFAFAFVGLIGLFPVALQNARMSRDETLIVNIARMVISEIQASPFRRVRLVTERNPDGSDKAVVTPPWDLSQKNSIAFNYQLVEDPNGVQRWNPVGVNTTPDDPVDTTPPPEFIVRVSSTILGPASVTNTPRLAQVTVTVETPATSPAAQRESYPFTVLLRERN